MIDLLIKLLEKFIELAKHRKEVEEKPFTLLISPLYSKLEEVHRDYLCLFESCHSELKNGIQLEVVAKHLAIDRVEQEALRRSVIAFAGSYRDNPRLNPYEGFFSEVEHYFWDNNMSGRDTRSSLLLESIRVLISEKGEPKRFKPFIEDFTEEDIREGLTELTQQMLSGIRKSWKKISKEYARLSAKKATG